MARPAEAAALLAAHRDDPDPDQPGEPADPEPAPDVDLNLVDDAPDDPEPDDHEPDDHEPDAPETATRRRVRGGARPGRSSSYDPVEPPVEPPIDDETAPVPDPQAVAEQAHTSLGVDSPFGDLTAKDLRAARPRVVLYFHLSDAAVRDGHGVVRLEGGDPLTLDPAPRLVGADRVCGAGAAGVDPGRHRAGRRLRDPGPGAGRGPVAGDRRHLPVGQLHRRHHGSGPHRALRRPRRRRPTRARPASTPSGR